MLMLVSLTGCGSSVEDDPSAMRDLAQMAALELGQARNLSASAQYATQRAGARPQQAGCMTVDIDRGRRGRGDDRFRVVVFDVDCSGGNNGYALVAIGGRVWAQRNGGAWHPAQTTPAAAARLATATVRPQRVLVWGRGIEASPGEGYRVRLPARVLADDPGPGASGWATVAVGGHAIKELRATVRSGDATARVDQTFRIGGAPPINPPVTRAGPSSPSLRDASALRAFVESVWGCAPPSRLSATAPC